MNPLPPELFLILQKWDTARHLAGQHLLRLAEARRRAAADRLELERAWQVLRRAMEAESRSREELLALTN